MIKTSLACIASGLFIFVSGSLLGEERRPNIVYILADEDNSLELYNIRKDISEKNNLAATQPDKARAMHEKLIAWRKEVNALMPTPKPAEEAEAANSPNSKKKKQ